MTLPTEAAAEPFLEDEVDLCLRSAASIRGSCLHPDDLRYDAEYEEQIKEAKMWDDLALKIARHVALEEFEKQCSSCDEGIKHGSKCLSCLGTGLWPPTDDGERIYPELRA